MLCYSRTTYPDTDPDPTSPPNSLPPLSPDSASKTTSPNNFCDTPSNFGSPYAMTSLCSYTTESDNEDRAEVTWERREYTLGILEGHLLSALRRHLPVAALVIPRIRAFMTTVLPLTHICNEPSPCYDAGSSTQPIMPTSTSNTTSSTPSSKFSGTQSHKSKRRRGSDDEEQNRPDRPKKQRPRLDEILSQDGSTRKFACPFHRKDPLKYHRDNNLRYGPCMGPGWLELRHLKYVVN